MNSNIEKLRKITDTFLSPDDKYEELSPAIDELYSLYTDVTRLDADSDETRADIFLPDGKAIGTTWAAMCVREISRTKYFIRGLYYGIKEAQKRFKNTKIHILYAGTGPFATLAIPMTTLFSSSEISFTLLEINPLSIELLEETIKAFGAEEYIKEIVQCDATKYKADATNPIHLVVSETMQNALKKEPQVAISKNLVSQMADGGILIPQSIKVEAVLINPWKNAERMQSDNWQSEKFYHQLNTLLDLNIGTIRAYPEDFPSVEVEVPAGIDAAYNELSLLTTIQVFDDTILTYGQCSLTLPLKLQNISLKPLTANKLSFSYEISEQPGFRYSYRED